MEMHAKKAQRFLLRPFTSAIVVCVLWCASFGPPCWLADRRVIPRSRVAVFYLPLVTRMGDDLSSASRWLEWYATLFARPNSRIVDAMRLDLMADGYFEHVK